MKSLKGYTVLYKVNPRFAGKYTDNTLYTFTCGAVDEKDAVRQLRMSRLYTFTLKSGRTVKKFRRYHVVRVYTGDGIRYFTDYRGMTDRAVVVIKTRKPRWMNRNFFGKAK